MINMTVSLTRDALTRGAVLVKFQAFHHLVKVVVSKSSVATDARWLTVPNDKGKQLIFKTYLLIFRNGYVMKIGVDNEKQHSVSLFLHF